MNEHQNTWWDRWVYRLIRKGELNRAETFASRWFERGRVSAFTFANTAYRSGNYHLAAQRFLDELSNVDPGEAWVSRMVTAATRSRDSNLIRRVLDAVSAVPETEPRHIKTLVSALISAESAPEFNDVKTADLSITRILEEFPDTPEILYLRGQVLLEEGDVSEAQAVLANVARLAPERLEHHEALLKAHKGDPLWKRLEILEAGYESSEPNRAWLKSLAQARFGMRQFAEAIALFAQLDAQARDDSMALRKAEALVLLGRHGEARQYLKDRGEYATSKKWPQHGLGQLLQTRGHWAAAAIAYEADLGSSPSGQELHRCGFAFLRAYQLERALPYLRKASRSNEALSTWVYHEGLCHEKLGNNEAAIDCYLWAYYKEEQQYLLYRASYLARGTRYVNICARYLEAELEQTVSLAKGILQKSEALSAHETSLAMSRNDRELLYRYAVGSITEQDYLRSVNILSWLRDTEPELHQPTHFALALAQLKAGSINEALDSFMGSRAFWGPHGLDVSRQSVHPSHRHQRYLEFQRELPVESNKVLYEANHGDGLTCNVLPLLRENLKTKRGAGQLHVVVLNDHRDAPSWLLAHPNVRVVGRDTHAYLRHLATAGWLINNNTFPTYFTRREEQRYLNTWHGTPLKTLGRDIQSGTLDHRNAMRNFLHATHMIFPNEHTARVLIDRYDVSGLYSGKAALTGYPRIDLTVRSDEARVRWLQKYFGSDNPIVLYAPTWRGTLADRQFDTDRLMSDLERLTMLPITVVFQPHPLTAPLISALPLGVSLVPDEMDTNEFLSAVDVLITDYSSIFFDFYALDRPVVFYAYDEEEYFADRGAYFELKNLPGTKCSTDEELVEAVCRSLETKTLSTEHASLTREEFSVLEDGKATERTLKFFFEDDESNHIDTRFGREHRREMLFFQGSFIPNGITSSYQALMQNLVETNNYNLNVVFQPEAVFGNEERLEKFNQLPDGIRWFGRVGKFAATPEEEWLIDRFNTNFEFFSERHRRMYYKAFSREFNRIFGAARFDNVVCFEGYARFWAALLAAGAESLKAKSYIYLHNDMQVEHETRFPYLKAVFALYRSFEKLISVSESVNEVNLQYLSQNYSLESKQFTILTNLIDPAGIRERATEGQKLPASFVGDKKLFVSTGRLTRQKGHDILLDAFSVLAETRDDCVLAIIGDGPLLEQLRSDAEQRGIKDRILFPGYIENPLAAVSQADCFVFPSRYEGQGLSLVEALVLGVPSIGTDVVGVRSVLANGEGTLVTLDVSALAQAMNGFMEGNVGGLQVFNSDDYVRDALGAFERLMLQ